VILIYDKYYLNANKDISCDEIIDNDNP
jgi:hypothetical protein